MQHHTEKLFRIINIKGSQMSLQDKLINFDPNHLNSSGMNIVQLMLYKQVPFDVLLFYTNQFFDLNPGRTVYNKDKKNMIFLDLIDQYQNFQDMQQQKSYIFSILRRTKQQAWEKILEDDAPFTLFIYFFEFFKDSIVYEEFFLRFQKKTKIDSVKLGHLYEYIFKNQDGKTLLQICKEDVNNIQQKFDFLFQNICCLGDINKEKIKRLILYNQLGEYINIINNTQCEVCLNRQFCLKIRCPNKNCRNRRCVYSITQEIQVSQQLKCLKCQHILFKKN